jgi:mandelate racemase
MTTDDPAIAAIRVRPVRIPIDPPLRTASGAADTAPLVLIDVVADNGVTGHGYVFVYRDDVLGAVTTLLHGVGPLLIGGSAAPRTAIDGLRTAMTLLGTAGLVDMALAGLDIALWDVLARSSELPLVRLLGGRPAPIRAYASLGMDGPQQAAAAAAAAARSGFTAVKVKIGYADLAEDLAVVRSVRLGAGPALDIMADYNQALTLPQALDRCRALDDEGITWIEEPVGAQDLVAHARVAEMTRTPVQLGENAYGSSGIADIITARASDLIMLDLCKVGGVSGWLNAAALCDAANLPYSDHFYQETSAHLMALSPRAHLLEYYGLADPILANPVSVDAGFVIAGEQPGNGIEWNEDAVARYALDDRTLTGERGHRIDTHPIRG